RSLCLVFENVEFFFDLMKCFRIGGFDLFGEPIPFDSIQHDHGEQDEKEQNDPDLFKIADDRRYRAAKEITEPREYHHPKPAAYRIEHNKAEQRHFSDAVKHAHRQTDAVDIF